MDDFIDPFDSDDSYFNKVGRFQTAGSSSAFMGWASSAMMFRGAAEYMPVIKPKKCYYCGRFWEPGKYACPHCGGEYR